jgi:hypothetical protein
MGNGSRFVWCTTSKSSPTRDTRRTQREEIRASTRNACHTPTICTKNHRWDLRGATLHASAPENDLSYNLNAEVQLRANEIERERSEQPKFARLLQRTFGERQRRGCIETAHPAPRNTQADEGFLGQLLAGFRR